MRFVFGIMGFAKLEPLRDFCLMIPQMQLAGLHLVGTRWLRQAGVVGSRNWRLVLVAEKAVFTRFVLKLYSFSVVSVRNRRLQRSRLTTP
jgi:hypothetical protein